MHSPAVFLIYLSSRFGFLEKRPYLLLGLVGDLHDQVDRECFAIISPQKTRVDEHADAAVGLTPNTATGGLDGTCHRRIDVAVVPATLERFIVVVDERLALKIRNLERNADDNHTVQVLAGVIHAFRK